MKVVQRHEALRTTFRAVDGIAVQVIASDGRIPIPVVDLQRLPAEPRAHEVQRRVDVEAQLPFDLACWLLARAQILRLTPTKTCSCSPCHHIVADAWSMSVLTRELAALYDAFRQGRPSPLAELPIQYVDFAHWQRQAFAHQGLDRQLEYWRHHLHGAPAVLALPTDRPRPAMQSHRGARLRFDLPEPLGRALKALGRAHGVTLFMTLLAAFQPWCTATADRPTSWSARRSPVAPGSRPNT